AFDFDHDHLYQFSYKNRTGILNRINHPYTDKPPFTDEVLIGDLALKPGTVITYLFDFGDNWEFDVKLERIDPVDHKMKKPVILQSHGDAPEQYPTWDEE
ncbi:MAG: plasmid pRiA4b ORF-3 family protein, partial [Deltaproteobacteria bacterium]|nr:plasmid pRiA4b ORF-3 family protein [Deltaproteobacteria bacterium]